jgi:hypothetical protein
MGDFIRLLHSNGYTRQFRDLCPATGLYATIRSLQSSEIISELHNFKEKNIILI